MSSPRTGLRVSLVVAASLVVSALLVPAAKAGTVTVTLIPKSPTTLPQGMAFEFTVKVENPDAVSHEVTVVERLAPVGGSSRVDFVQNEPTIPPGETRFFNHDIVTAQYFSEIGAFVITAMLDGAPAATLSFDVTPATVVPPTFDDVTQETGVGTPAVPAPVCDGQLSAGAAWADYDNDGHLDLYVPHPDAPAKLFMNDGTGHFTDRAGPAGVTNSDSIGRAAVAGDYDNDGDQDIYVVNEGPARLYRNNVSQGQNTFTDVTFAAGVANDEHDPSFGTSASWGDYDEDGLLDLYVTNYATCEGVGQADKLYHQEPDHTFTDRTFLLEGSPDCLPAGCTTGYGFQAAWFDYDRDLDLDLYLANDFNTWYIPNPDTNRLWRNNGNGTFTEVSDEANAAPPDLQSMGIGIADTDGDLDLDLAISDIRGNKALRNNGGTFVEISDGANLDRPWEFAGIAAITWGLAFHDFNLDQSEDLYVAAGAILVPGQGNQGPRYNQLFVNAGGGVFADLSKLSGADTGRHSRGVALADYDRDGWMDMYVVNHDSGPILYRNTTGMPGRHWIEVDPVGTVSNRDGCGAVVVVWVGGKRMMRQVFCGSVSLGSGHDPYVHFGLGSATKIDKMLILWPSGERQVRRNVPADRDIRVFEPAG
jgi:enediyne biosynthesis protein E4